METISYPKEVRASKDHHCDLCCEKIRKGGSYFTSTHKQDGDIYNWKTHKYCSEIAVRLKMYDYCDEGLSSDEFQETIHSEYLDLLVSIFSEQDVKKYSNIIQELKNVQFRDKLMYVIRHYNSIDKTTLKL